ncbi:S1 family peptidase [Nocardia transvalensis]|uniref:S1 family peptidase n=1 Tax=Nocardia transvalensis TaxID=37333 RepID=UPI0018945C87|nr:S1 family peptidase [Nocardia transvalensis]MBF6330106.1 protease [Nocardia transvalensis]
MEFGIRARRVALGCCVVATVVGSMACPASATPQPQDVPLPPELVEALQRDLKIGAQQYLERTRNAQRLADFARIARVAHPTVFAGVRMDGDRPIVSLTNGTSSSVARKSAEQAGFIVETVAQSEAALRERRIAFQRWLSRQPATLAESVIGYAVDVVHNTVTVRVTKDVQFPSEAGPVRSIAAIAPTTGPFSGSPISRSTPDSLSGEAVFGGQPYAFDFNGRTGKCSFGFNGTDAAGNAVNLTAGHCNPDNLLPPGEKPTEPRQVFETSFDAKDKRRGDPLGSFEKSNLGPHDYAVIRIADSQAHRFRNNMVTTRRITVPGPLTSGSGSGSGIRPPTSSSEGLLGPLPAAIRIDGTMDPVVGATVCKAGLRTGYTCGMVIETDLTLDVRQRPEDPKPAHLEHMFAANVCGQHGDSGGPIFAGTKAVGVNSAVAMDPTAPEDGCGFLALLVGQPINPVLQANPGLTVRTN